MSPTCCWSDEKECAMVEVEKRVHGITLRGTVPPTFKSNRESKPCAYVFVLVVWVTIWLHYHYIQVLLLLGVIDHFLAPRKMLPQGQDTIPFRLNTTEGNNQKADTKVVVQ